MSRSWTQPLLWLAWILVVVALLLPVGAMLLRSITHYRVVMRDGKVYEAVGEVIESDEDVTFDIQLPGEDEKRSWMESREDVAEVRTVYSFDHYRRVFEDDRTFGLMRNSITIGLGGALFALLLGLPVAWFLARTRLPGRGLLAVLSMTPAILPPFFVALGGARRSQDLLIQWLGVAGGTLQLWNSVLVFGFVLYPLYVLLVGPALRAVPAGPWEAARILGGRRAALRHVTIPAVLPSIVGAFVLVFVIALTDFAVPDVLGFMLPKGPPTHVFATEILLQWKQNGNAARAVATGAPYLAVTLLLLLVALAFLRRSPILTASRGERRREPVRLRARGLVLGYVVVLGTLAVGFGVPIAGVAGWAGSGAESAASGTSGTSGAVPAKSVGAELFDFSTTLDRTTGSREELARWLRTGLAAALLAMLIAAPLARLATRGGRFARMSVLAAGALPLAMPGLVLGAGTLLLWQAIPGDWPRPFEDWIVRSTLALAVKFLPFALLASWLVLRRVRPGHEEAAAMLGAGRWTRTWRVLTPSAWMGVVAGGLLVLVFALREFDTVYLIDVRILPIRLYDKIHFNRMADEANLLFLCLGCLLVPALVGLGVATLRGPLAWLWQRLATPGRWAAYGLGAIAGACGLVWLLWDAPFREVWHLLVG